MDYSEIYTTNLNKLRNYELRGDKYEMNLRKFIIYPS
jgi:hypothetical protein